MFNEHVAEPVTRVAAINVLWGEIGVAPRRRPKEDWVIQHSSSLHAILF